MKVVTVKEPYASLICKGLKKQLVENTKTEYRGELYIHVSKSKISKNDSVSKKLMKKIGEIKPNYGEIVAKCILKDCILIDDKYINNIKKNKKIEYDCGTYEIGKYVWILDDIQLLDRLVFAKGNHNIWDYYNEYDCMNIMNDIKEYNDEELDIRKYLLQKPIDLMKTKKGLVFDQVELERFLLKNTVYDIKTYCIVYKGNNYPIHTFLTFYNQDHYYWIENSWIKYKGIHRYKTLSELILDVRSKFIQDELNFSSNLKLLEIYEYSKPDYNVSIDTLYNHFLDGKLYQE